MQLLFERLTKPNKLTPKSEQDKVEYLKRSVMSEIARIMSTRSYFSKVDSSGPDILTFGIPRTSNFSETSEAELHELRSDIEQAIRRFEPRLQQPSAVLHRDVGAVDPVSITISGYLTLGKETELVSFPMFAAAVAA